MWEALPVHHLLCDYLLQRGAPHKLHRLGLVPDTAAAGLQAQLWVVPRGQLGPILGLEAPKWVRIGTAAGDAVYFAPELQPAALGGVLLSKTNTRVSTL